MYLLDEDQIVTEGAPAGFVARGLRTLQLFGENLFGRTVFLLLRFKFRLEFREMVPLAIYLEGDVFPELRKRKITVLSLIVNAELGSLIIDGYDFPLSNVANLSQRMTNFGIQRLDLDTTLESGQIVEAFLLLCYVRAALDDAMPALEEYSGWNAGRIASAMLGPHGCKKFCALVRYESEEGVLVVRYSYCPLYLSRLVQNYTQVSGRFSDHRALFQLAPRVAVLVILSFSAPALLLAWSTTASVVATMMLGSVTSLCIGLGLYTIGSIQYDKEHYESIRNAHLARIRHLSRFPETNPNPIIELGLDGTVTYANAAAQEFLASVGLSEADTSALLPEDREDLVRQCLQSPDRPHHLEFAVGGNILNYTLSAFPDDQAVIASGSDITHLKEVEAELRSLNERLEALVAERTSELALTQDVTILTLASLAEKRDPETGRHLERTRHYVGVLARHLVEHPKFSKHLNEESMQQLFKSAPLHDIGKVGVPDAILLKPGPLTPEEFEEIKKHPIYGGDALRIAEKSLGFNSFLTMAKDIAYYHHERWDGNGYPYGLKGEDIPWSARLMALADGYDARLSKRPYKEPWSHERARDEIVNERGSQFDPDVVDAFVEAESEFLDIAHRYAEVERQHATN